MMLSLDHNQRINLVFVLGAHDVKGRDLHAVWHLQDLFELDAAEREQVELRQETVNGQTISQWNAAKVSAREFEVSDADVTRIRTALDEFPQMRASRDRLWAAGVYAQLNGKGAPAEAAALSRADNRNGLGGAPVFQDIPTHPEFADDLLAHLRKGAEGQ